LSVFRIRPCHRIPRTAADRFCDRAARASRPPTIAGGTSLLIRIRGWLFCHRYSLATCPNRRRTCLLLNLPISKSVVRLNATEPAWPNIFQSPCAQSIAAAGLGQSIGSPAVTPPSLKSKGKATKEVISVIGYNCLSTPPNLAQQFDSGWRHYNMELDGSTVGCKPRAL
jgi:hypothetical protein